MENTSGIYPAGYRVLIRPDKIEEFSEGGICIRPKEQKEFQAAQQIGTVIALGPLAYEDQTQPWCQPGDRVLHSRYEGDTLPGIDGEEYRVVNDKSVIAFTDESLKLGELDNIVRREPYAQAS